MIGVPGREGNRDVQVIIGVDTHQDEHVAVAIDRQGVRLGERHAPATTHGYGELEWWSPEFWGKFAPSGSKARVPTALASPVS